MTDSGYQWRLFQAMLDPAVGSERAGGRPVLVVSNEAINESLPIVTVLPLTTRKRCRRVYSTEVLLTAGSAGQPADTLAMAHLIRTISKSRLDKAYGRLDDPGLRQQVRTAIRLHLDLDD